MINLYELSIGIMGAAVGATIVLVVKAILKDRKIRFEIAKEPPKQPENNIKEKEDD